ncbi:hypothetical protein ASE86_10510 [Sphingomonas sp. Leaf33]|uniref:type II toxin-antitoxin system VapC family toxin n=1 Tax=Sphingomonas sp. Leaf33 TaxID=1736215 RepID=UPI0006F5AF72|nr:type II toxin-antitoxin system VapC family toxin [Sphingomonas sp. Leaf33]KQN26521.1 hypothetical protein ASE86_10510 [Sphingomonas sp. Leaf33]
MILLDTNILVDVLEDPDDTWSRETLRAVSRERELVTNLVVVAELCGNVALPEDIEDSLRDADIIVLDLSFDVARRAGVAFREYRRRGGPRTTILPDFLIAAHATILGANLMTRDRRLASYFPELTLITPDTDNG